MSTNQVEQNGKTYMLGKPRAYIVIMKKGSFTLAMSMLSHIKFRMDWDEDTDVEGNKVMTSEVTEAYNALKPFMNKRKPGYATTVEYGNNLGDALKLLEVAKDVLDPVIPFEEATAPIKALKNFQETVEEVFMDKLPKEAQEKKTQLDALSKEIDELQTTIYKLKQQGYEIHKEISEDLQQAQKAAETHMEESGQKDSMEMIISPFCATTNKNSYDYMKAKGMPGIYISPYGSQSAADKDFGDDTEDGDD